MEVFGFILSVALLAYTTRLISLRIATSRADRYFLAVAAAVGQLEMLSLVLSIFDGFSPGPFLIAQALLLAITVILCKPRRRLLPTERSNLIRDVRCSLSTSKLHLLLAIVLGLFIVSTALEQWMLPVWDFDDGMYHASRAAYWIQNHSIFAYITQNDRQIAFPLTGEMTFGWALMFSRYEPIARFIFWLAYPLSGIGVWFAIRELTRDRSTIASTIGTLVFCATPIVLYHTQTVHPDLWLTLFSTGVEYFTARLFATRAGAAGVSPSDVETRSRATQVSPLRSTVSSALALGVFAALAFGTRSIALPLLVAIPVVAATSRLRCRGLAASVLGIALGLALSGSLAVFAQSQVRDGTILGSPQMRATHAAETSGKQIYTHAARAILTLLDAPLAPTESMRTSIDAAKNNTARAFGAGEPLPLEHDGDWPGPQRFVTPARSAGLSVAGWFCLPALVVAIVLALKARQMTATAAIACVAGFFWAATVFGIRWMDGMPRFWLGPYVLALVVLVAIVARVQQKRWLTVTVAALLAVMVIPSLYDRALIFYASLPTHQPPEWYYDEPFQEPLKRIPEGSTIVLLGHADARDYPLFRPRAGLTNSVRPWGKQRFDAARMSALLDKTAPRATHVLIQDDRELNLYWDGWLPSGPFVAFMRNQPGWGEVPLRTPGMRLFARQTPPR